MGDGPKILVADDEPDCVDFVRAALAEMPCEVIAASDGAEALRLARENKPDLIILDVQMPQLNGFEVFRRLRGDADLSGVPVVMLTAVTERTGIDFSAEDVGQFMGSEPEAYIDKPIEPIVLQQSVRRLLKGKLADA